MRIVRPLLLGWGGLAAGTLLVFFVVDQIPGELPGNSRISGDYYFIVSLLAGVLLALGLSFKPKKTKNSKQESIGQMLIRLGVAFQLPIVVLGVCGFLATTRIPPDVAARFLEQTGRKLTPLRGVVGTIQMSGEALIGLGVISAFLLITGIVLAATKSQKKEN